MIILQEEQKLISFITENIIIMIALLVEHGSIMILKLA